MNFIANPTLTKEQTEFANNRYWYHENIQQHDSLLIVAGDSWTWGDSLHGIDGTQGIYDDPQRLTSIYGHLLAEKLNFDFVNLAKTGCSNMTIYNYVCDILPHVVLNYKKIYVVMTLTENCRESWLHNIWTPSEDSSLDQFHEAYEKMMFDSIQQNLILKHLHTLFYLILVL
jgi:hypothetical protein